MMDGDPAGLTLTSYTHVDVARLMLVSIEIYVNHDIKNFNENCSLGSNPLRLPLNRGRDKLLPC